MQKVISKDGTPIAFDKAGQGLALILVDGALCGRSFGPMPKLAPILAQHFTVYWYDRRGRGDSGDTTPYTVDREIEDLEALIQEAGGTAFVFGVSSGAALALEAANRLPNIKKLALYEAPFIVDDSREPLMEDYVTRLKALVAADRRGDAIKMFMKAVGVPSFFIFIMRFMPVWSKILPVAHTLPYDFAIVNPHQHGKPLSRKRWTSVLVPTLVADGSKSPVWMRNAMQALASVLPNAQRRTLEGQTHNVSLKVLAPVLCEFFGA